VVNPVLVLLDLQADFLARPGLSPSAARLEDRIQTLLEGCRDRAIPVLHVRTLYRADGSDRMPHWKRAGTWACLEGTPGALPPAGLVEAAGEPVFRKRFFSAFGAPGLEARLRELNPGPLLLAGVYLHGCVRASALDAYERGYEVWIVDDAVGSTEPVHAEITRNYLSERAARFFGTRELFEVLSGKRQASAAGADHVFPVAWISGCPRAAGAQRRLVCRQPSDLRVRIGEVPLAEQPEVAAAAAAAASARPGWEQRSAEERSGLLRRFAARLGEREQELTLLLVREIGKPRGEAQAEVRRAIAHVEGAVRRIPAGEARIGGPESDTRVRYRPVGTVGLVTPWNNPLAIPVGKIAPALAFGNSVIWKPAIRAPRTALAVMAALHDAGIPGDLVNLVFGEADTARCLIADAGVDAVSITGSSATGRRAAALCAQHGKPLQAELGGNNAALVLADCDVESEARGLALAAFGFAGQRCTATRRIIVEQAVAARFTDALVAAVGRLAVGAPEDPDTQVGPLVSPEHREEVAAALEQAVAGGARILCGGAPPPGLPHGCYFLPTLVTDLDPGAPLAQEETFGPVAVMLPAADLDQAIRIANGVPQGLVASVCTRDPEARERFARAIEAGILKLAPGALAVDPEAPFCGWKASGIGPPEHGDWDREFYARPQAVYRGGTLPAGRR
jgi:acyl-CoA reductase-like NAD-dependent aldehyde dehydrogenase/nicotinamidase-related amidase